MTIEAELLASAGDREPPADLRARLEEMLVAQKWVASDIPELEEVDGPLVVPARVDSRLQGTLTGIAKRVLDQADAPREMPAAMRARLERALAPSIRKREAMTRALAVAASVLLLAASSVAVLRGERAPERARAPVAVDTLPEGSFRPPMPTSSFPEVGGIASLPDQAGASAGGLGSAPALTRGPAPPFAYGDDVAARLPGGNLTGPSHRPPPARPSFTIATIPGDDEQVAGFNAYIGLLNEHGGVAHQHRLATRTVKEPHEAPDGVVAIVNLSGSGATGPISNLPAPYLETMATAENAMNGSVYALGGSPERQARIAVDHIFPQEALGETAVIYKPSSGVLGTSVADAFQDALEDRGVRAVQVEVDGSRPTVTIPADAAFLSLPDRLAQRWLADAESAEYRPERGIGGIFSLGSAALAKGLPEGSVVASPYALDLTGGEMRELLARADEEMSSDLIHGWVTAKAIAIAMWRRGVYDVDQMASALDSLRGWDFNFFPGYDTREGTHIRTPDASIHIVTNGRLVRKGWWLTDLSGDAGDG